VFKKYSQMKLQMKREALAKLNRQANESGLSFGTAWDTKMMEPSQVTLLKSPTVWSGRGDLNARPPAPKAVSGLARKCPIFNGFCFNKMWPTG
jgi:hypothetical protein